MLFEKLTICVKHLSIVMRATFLNWGKQFYASKPMTNLILVR